LIHKDRVRGEVFEAEIDRTSNAASAMDSSGWHDDALPTMQSKPSAVGEINLQRSLHHEKQLVGTWMLVPRVFAVDDRKPKATCVHLTEDLIAIRDRDRCGFGVDVDDSERRETHRLVRVLST
jgi:hypothetical protein